MEVGGELDSKGYGIGLPKNSPYRDIISKEILKLSESQVLLGLYNNWWNVSWLDALSDHLWSCGILLLRLLITRYHNSMQ